MSHNEARAWWADVEHLREQLEPPGGPTVAPTAPVIAPDSPPRERRTVRITGQGSGPITPRPLVETGHRRAIAPRSGGARATRRPDQIALWAVFLGFALVLVAITSTHA